MTRTRSWLILGLAVLALSGMAIAQTNQGTALLNSPVKVQAQDFGPTLVRSAPWAGTANFGLCQDLSDGSLWGTDLYTATIYQYDAALNLIQGIPGIAGLQVGVAYDPAGDAGAGSLWVVDFVTFGLTEVDKTGTPTGGSVPFLYPGAAVPGPVTIDPGDSSMTFWLEDIALDFVFQLDTAGAVLNSHANPEGAGVFGNGLSYDAFDPFADPGNLHITSGAGAEGRVKRMWEGQPNSGIPRNYGVILEGIDTFDTFVNGIQSADDSTATPNEVWYMQANASNTIIEINDVPLPAIVQCAPGAVNLGTQAPPAVFSDDMESGEQAWWSHGADQGVDDWAIITSAEAHSGTHVWFTADVDTITDKHLDLTVDVTAPATELSFWHTFDFESHFDGGQLLVSTDGGATFTLLDSEILVGGYNGNFSTCCGNPAGGEPGWGDGIIGAMTEVVVDLSGFQGTGVIVRWRMISDSSVSNPGWEIDDVSMREATTCDGTLAQVLFVNRSPSTTAFSDDMESGAQPWWAHSAPIGIDDWAIRTTPFASSPVNAWTCIDDTTFTDKRLDLTVDLDATKTELRFMHTFFTENTFDGGNLSISTDGGGTFTLLEAEILEGGYTGTISTSFGSPIGGEPAWTGGAFGAMTQVRVDLSAFVPTTGAILRWRFGADSCCGPGSSGGWQVDDVELGTPAFEGTGGADYTLDFDTVTPLSFVLDEPPSRQGDGSGTNACIYAWSAEPADGDIVTVPKGLGTMCFGVWSMPPTRLPRRIFNGIGVPNKLGPNNGGASPPGIPEGGDFQFAKRPNGTGQAVTATLQGIIEDNCSQGTKPFSVTNGVLLRVQ